MQITNLPDLITTILDEQKASDIISLDVHKLTTVTDHIVIASGRSTRHVIAIAENIVEKLKQQQIKPLSMTGVESGEWVLIDYGTVLANVMLPTTRAFYGLEELWQMRQAKQVTPAVS